MLAVVVVVVLVAATVAGGGFADPTAAQLGGAATSSTIDFGPVPSTVAPSLTAAGRIAYVTPTGDVVVAAADGSDPRTVGSGAVRNARGLSPLAWSPVGDLVAFVRSDHALVLASTDGSEPPIIAATDAIVTPDASEKILSFDVTGTAIAYLRSSLNGTSQAAVALYDGPSKGEVIPLTDPISRIPVEFRFSPLDPILYLQSLSADTGLRLPVAVVDPFNHNPYPSPLNARDVVFAPDGASVYGVVEIGQSQIVDLDVVTGSVELLRDQDRICDPQPSPDGNRIAYGAGKTCNELWVMRSDGTGAKRVARLGGRSTLDGGMLSWSLDGTIVSHAACRAGTDETVTCGGAYLDVDVTTGVVSRRADAGSAVREYRPLIKPLKATVEMRGPVSYKGGMVVRSQQAPQMFRLPRDTTVKINAIDDRDERRSFDVQLLTTRDSQYVTGTIRIQDPAENFDQTMFIFGQVLVQSYRHAVLRAIWIQSSSIPFKSGIIDLTVYR